MAAFASIVVAKQPSTYVCITHDDQVLFIGNW